MQIIVCAGGPNPAFEKMVLTDECIMIGVDRGALHLINAGYPLDYAFGDFDSVSIDERTLIKLNTKQFYQSPSEKDDTDMQLALAFIATHFTNCHRIDVFGAMSGVGRVDHFLSNIWLAHDERFLSILDKLYFFEMNHEMHYLKSGSHSIQNRLNYRYLSLITLTPVAALRIENAKYELSPTRFKYPCALISNEFLSYKKEVSVSFESGIISVWYVADDHNERIK